MDNKILKSSIKAYCRELLETSTSGDAGGYLTKKAFRKPKPQDKNSPTGFESSPKPNMYTKTMKFKIVDPSDRIDAKDLWKGEHLEESHYTQFKKSTSKPKPREILHRAIKEIQLKLDEVNRLIEFTTRIKGELQENDQEIEYLKRTKDSLYKIQDKLKEAFQNISKINEIKINNPNLHFSDIAKGDEWLDFLTKYNGSFKTLSRKYGIKDWQITNIGDFKQLDSKLRYQIFKEIEDNINQNK